MTFKYQVTGESVAVETQEELDRLISGLRKQVENYEELSVDMEDDAAYVARGNGFCDAKYSEDFLDGQIEVLRKKLEEALAWKL